MDDILFFFCVQKISNKGNKINCVQSKGAELNVKIIIHVPTIRIGNTKDLIKEKIRVRN